MTIFRTIIHIIQKYCSPSMACQVQNIKQILKNRVVRFYFDKNTSLYYVADNQTCHYFANMNRGFSLYSNGFENRCKKLEASYLLNAIDITSDDIILDCGANYGDLFLLLKDRINLKNYYSFEPGKEEHRCILYNANGANNFNVALSNKSGNYDFYISSAGGDSSLIEPKTFTSIASTTTITLDEFIAQNSIKKIKLLKLEAEGFEPEILEGAKKCLSICEYVAIDGGNERGINEEETFTDQANILFDNGFFLSGIYFKWGRALFTKK